MKTTFWVLCVGLGLTVAPVSAQPPSQTTILPGASADNSVVASEVGPAVAQNPGGYAPQNIVMMPSDIRVVVVNDQDRSGPFAPYESVNIGLVFTHPERYRDVLESYSFDLSPLSRINGKPLPSSYLNNMSYGSWCDGDVSNAREGVVYSQGFGPVELLPRQPGTYRISLVVKTVIGTWRVPPVNVVVQVPNKERAAYQAFLRSGAKSFLDRENGIRSVAQVRSGQQPLPYASVKTFVRRHKTSDLTKRVLERARQCWETDAQQGNRNAQEDIRQVAEIIATIDPTSVVHEAMAIQKSAKAMLKKASPQEKSNLQMQVAGHERWIKMIRAAQKRV